MKNLEWKYLSSKINQIFQEKSNNPLAGKIEYWHYTSMDAILNIFRDYIDSSENSIDCFNLYASHIRFMNDSEEYNDGERFFRSCISKHKLKNYISSYDNAGINAYVISFCENGDLLSQWKWYGQNSGISFCFNANTASYNTYERIDRAKNTNLLKAETSSNMISPFYESFTKPLPVWYSENDKKDYFDFLIKKILVAHNNGIQIDKSNLDLLAYLFIPYCKNESFSEETERRLVFFDYDQGNPKTFEFNYVYNKGSNGVTKPALNVKIRHIKENEKHRFSKYTSTPRYEPLISKMIVGPGYNQHLVFNCLIHIFDRDAYNFQPDKTQINNTTKRSKHEKEVYTEDTIPTDNKAHYFTYIHKHNGKESEVETEAYKCSNGLLIIKSAIPFRS